LKEIKQWKEEKEEKKEKSLKKRLFMRTKERAADSRLNLA